MARHINIETLLIWAFRDEKVETTRNPNEDALTVYWAVMALPEPHGSMVRQYARDGGQPVWHAGASRIVSLDRTRRLRRTYGQWIRALSLLQHTLQGSLQTHKVYGPTAPVEPWSGVSGPSYSERSALLRPRSNP